MTDTLNIQVEKVKKSRLSDLNAEELPFGKVFTDHMLVAEYENGQWQSVKILPFGDLSVSPALAALHYGQAIFEGMKAYKNDKEEVFLFRPKTHYMRLNVSAQRMAMPEIPEELFMEGITQLLKLDAAWVPASEGGALYIRPLYISTETSVGVKISESYKLIIMLSPVGKYYSKPLKVLVEKDYTRAVDGGIGFVKAAGNYGRSMYPTKIAKEKGYDQLIWTDFATHQYVEESGTMNLMFVINDTLITPKGGDTILSGVTRDSVLTIARDMEIKVEERKISIQELIDAVKNGTLQEAFGTGTAATIAPIKTMGFNGIDYEFPSAENRPISTRIATELHRIRKNRVADKYAWMTKI